MKGDLLGDEDAAGLQSCVPGQTEVLTVDHSVALETNTGLTEGIGCFAALGPCRSALTVAPQSHDRH